MRQLIYSFILTLLWLAVLIAVCFVFDKLVGGETTKGDIAFSMAFYATWRCFRNDLKEP